MVLSYNIHIISGMNTKRTYLLYVVLFVHLIHFTCGEVFTALADMEKLVSTELKLVQYLEDYIKGEESKLEHMKT